MAVVNGRVGDWTSGLTFAREETLAVGWQFMDLSVDFPQGGGLCQGQHVMEPALHCLIV